VIEYGLHSFPINYLPSNKEDAISHFKIFNSPHQSIYLSNTGLSQIVSFLS